MTGPFPYPTHRGAKVTISLKADADDYERLKTLGDGSGLNQSLTVHLLLELMRLRLSAAQGQANLAVDQLGSPLEAYAWLVALDSGLISQGELEAGAWTVRHTSAGALFNERIDGLFALLQRRFAERYGAAPNLAEESEPFKAVVVTERAQDEE